MTINSTTTSALSFTSDAGGLHVKVPFDLKDHFKTAFKTATWEGYAKTWRLNDTSVTRNKLTKYIETVITTGVLAAIENKEELDATEAEIQRWTAELNQRKALIEQQAERLGVLAVRKSKLDAIIASFKALQPAVDDGKAKLDAEQAKAAAVAKDLRAKVDELLSPFPQAGALMDQARKEWRRLAAGKYQAKSVVEQAQAALGRIYDQVKAKTGVGLEALNKAYMCNTNRPDRDDIGRELDRLYTAVVFPPVED